MAIITNISTVPVLYKSRDGVNYTITTSTSITLPDSEVTWNTVDSGVINGWLTVTKDDLSAMFDSYGNIVNANPIPVSLESSSVTISGPITVSNEVEIKNDIGNPIPVSGTVTVNAGTNLNTSLLALEAGGNLAGINAKTPALGQALAASSVPVVLTASQISTLTPLSTVTVNAGTNLNTSLLALESGGHLASLDTKTPALGQALAAGSVPVVLTAAQLSALAAASDPQNAPITSATVLTVGGSAVTAGRGIAINCTVAGNVTVALSGGASHTFPVVAGYTLYPYAVTQVTASTATAVFSNMS